MARSIERLAEPYELLGIALHLDQWIALALLALVVLGSPWWLRLAARESARPSSIRR